VGGGHARRFDMRLVVALMVKTQRRNRRKAGR
jgi:hypothetical protein